MKTPVVQWTCGTCPNTGTGTKPPYFILDPAAAVPGTRIGVCDGCKRDARAANKLDRKVSVVAGLASVLAAQTSESAETAESGDTAPRAPTSGDRPELGAQATGTCERCCGPIVADAVRRRKPRTTCSERCRVALWHARKKAA